MHQGLLPYRQSSSAREALLPEQPETRGAVTAAAAGGGGEEGGEREEEAAEGDEEAKRGTAGFLRERAPT